MCGCGRDRLGELGEIYRCRMFYGNGTARLCAIWRGGMKGRAFFRTSARICSIPAGFGSADIDDRICRVTSAQHLRKSLRPIT